MPKRKKHEKGNLVSLFLGIIFILIGLIGSALTIPTRSLIIILPVLLLFLGAFLALMGGLRKW